MTPAMWAVNVSKWVDVRKDTAQAVFQATGQDALAYVKNLTPVDTGYLRASWNVALASAVQPVGDLDGSADPDLVLAQAEIGDTIIIFNPVVYAARINYGFIGEDSLGRHFHQAGAHMVEATIAALPEIAQAAATRINRQ